MSPSSSASPPTASSGSSSPRERTSCPPPSLGLLPPPPWPLREEGPAAGRRSSACRSTERLLCRRTARASREWTCLPRGPAAGHGSLLRPRGGRPAGGRPARAGREGAGGGFPVRRVSQTQQPGLLLPTERPGCPDGLPEARKPLGTGRGKTRRVLESARNGGAPRSPAAGWDGGKAGGTTALPRPSGTGAVFTKAPRTQDRTPVPLPLRDVAQTLQRGPSPVLFPVLRRGR